MASNSNILARGIRISRSNLDDFLQRHKLYPSTPKRLHEYDAKRLDDLFVRLGVKGKIRLFEPHLTSFKASDHVFLCYDWVYVLAEKEVESSLRKGGPPEGFLEVAEQIQKGGKVGTWVICFEEEWGLFEKEKFADSDTYRCGLCDDVLEDFTDMCRHQENAHGQEGRVIPPC